MRRFVPLVLLATVAWTASAQAQADGGGRTPDRPIFAPSLPALEAPGLSTNPLRFLDGAKPADDILKSLDKDLGRSSLGRTEDEPRDRPMEGPRYRPDEDLSKDPAALSTF
jgi:hypothetical protein